jgi:hypothetical protein
VAERKSFLIRLPAEVLDELNRWAKDDLRSLNGQIEYLLREATVQRGRAARRGRDDGGSPPKGRR